MRLVLISPWNFLSPSLSLSFCFSASDQSGVNFGTKSRSNYCPRDPDSGELAPNVVTNRTTRWKRNRWNSHRNNSAHLRTWIFDWKTRVLPRITTKVRRSSNCRTWRALLAGSGEGGDHFRATVRSQSHQSPFYSD